MIFAKLDLLLSLALQQQGNFCISKHKIHKEFRKERILCCLQDLDSVVPVSELTISEGQTEVRQLICIFKKNTETLIKIT